MPYSFYTPCLSPESFEWLLIERGRSSGLLPVCCLPVIKNSGLKNKQFTEFTATGIAPDFNGIPF